MTVGAAAPAQERPLFGLAEFVRSAGFLSFGSLAGFLRALVTAKVLALALGPASVGILSQLLNFSALLGTVVALGLTTGVVKAVADARGDSRRVGEASGTAIVISFVSAAVVAVVLAPFAVQVSVALTGRPAYALLVVLIVASFPLYNVSGALGYVLQGLSAVRLLTYANVANAIAALVILVPSTLRFGLFGAVLAVLITSGVQALLFGAAVAIAYRSRRWSVRTLSFSGAEARTLLFYGGIVLTGGVASYASVLLVRTETIHVAGDYGNGLYQVASGLSNQVVTVFMTWMAAYVFPRIAAAGREQVSGLVNSGMRANLFVMAPLLTATIALRVPLIHLLYSTAFLPAQGLVPPQLTGDFVRVVGWSMAVALFARGRTVSHLVVIAGQAAAWIAFSSLLVPLVGASGASAGYAVSLLAYPLLGYLLLSRGGIHLSVTRENLALCAVGAAGIAIASTLPWFCGVAAAVALPATVVLMRLRPAASGTPAPATSARNQAHR